MKVLIVGGAGVFGSRLAALLKRDGRHVTIAGRNPAAAARAARAIGCESLVLDRAGDLSAIKAHAFDVVVDAAGPFQHYGHDPYRLARACVEAGRHYFDLSDDAAFAAGVVALDDEARARGCVVLSGASSVPAISSAAVTTLAAKMRTIHMIESAILPGNRAPRGRSLVAAILEQAGAPMRVWRGGWRSVRAWSEPRRYDIGCRQRRTARLIGAPDLQLFAEAFAAESVTFRAGMELGFLNGCVSLYACARRCGLIRPWSFVIDAALAASKLLEPFGTDRGAMIVDVIGEEEGRTRRRTWRLIAEAGAGPYVPATPIRAALRKLDDLPHGARPCVAALSLAELSDAMRDLAITTHEEAADIAPLFQRALGPRWTELAPAVRDLHSVWNERRFAGSAEVTRGRGVIAALIAALIRFPKPGADVPVEVAILRTPAGETWTRRFAGRTFRSYLSAPPHAQGSSGIRERFGPFSFDIALRTRDGALDFPLVGGRMFGVPLPRALLPLSVAAERAADDGFRFDVALYAPPALGGLIVRYAGRLQPVENPQRLQSAEAGKLSSIAIPEGSVTNT